MYVLSVLCVPLEDGVIWHRIMWGSSTVCYAVLHCSVRVGGDTHVTDNRVTGTTKFFVSRWQTHRRFSRKHKRKRALGLLSVIGRTILNWKLTNRCEIVNWTHLVQGFAAFSSTVSYACDTHRGFPSCRSDIFVYLILFIFHANNTNDISWRHHHEVSETAVFTQAFHSSRPLKEIAEWREIHSLGKLQTFIQ